MGSGLRSHQVLRAEGPGQQIVQTQFKDTLFRLSDVYAEVSGKLRKDLTAGTAGPIATAARIRDGQRLEFALAFGDSLEDGNSLGTNGEPEGRVLDVTAEKHISGSRQECRADRVAGIGSMGERLSVLCQSHQVLGTLEGHHGRFSILQ